MDCREPTDNVGCIKEMLNKELYKAIFKRKSFHLFRNVGSDRISQSELAGIEMAFQSFEKLYPDIKTAVRIVAAERILFKRDAEYCILIYSEKKQNYLLNAGYLGEQLDLYLVSHNIGSLWFGIGKPDERTFDGLDYVIMLAVHKIGNDSLFRRDMFKAARKPVEEIWKGDTLNVAEIARFAPSACNTQPWYVENDGQTLTVFRYKKDGKRGIMPISAVNYFNRIDIGIFLCILEICMANESIDTFRTLFADVSDAEYSKVAEYRFACPHV